MTKAKRGVRVFKLVWIGYGVMLLAGLVVLDATGYDFKYAQPEQVSPVQSVIEVNRLISENDCWTGNERPNVIPSHAVVTLADSAMPTLETFDTGWAVVEGKTDGTLHAVCSIELTR